MTLKVLQNFYKATTSKAWAIGTGNRYISILPTPTSGYLVINPSNTSKREIIAYTAIGTDGDGNYVTVSARGVGGTTDQTHTRNEPVRMNITAEHYSAVQTEVTDLQDQIDTLVLQNAPASTTSVLGIVKMSAAPADPASPIAVATTDAKYVKIDAIPDTFVNTSAGAGDVGKGVKLNASGVLDQTFTTAPIVRTYLNAASPATWTKPTGLKYVVVEVQAGGGGGGDAANSGTTSDAGGGGGGGGGYSRKLVAVATLGSTETVTTGAGGSSQISGENSSFGSHVTATGGTGAVGESAGGAGGIGSSGDVNIKGQGGQGGKGSSSTNVSAGTGGQGGSSVLGGGAGSVTQSTTTGADGGVYGGGGGGASASGNNNSASGGSGAAGIVIVTEYYN